MLDEHPGRIAGMIIEPMMMNAGIIPPEPGYLEGLRDLPHAHGALLAFDEVKTGFTVGPGGATAATGDPDIVCLAKAIGGGMSTAAIGGTEEVMSSWPTATTSRSGRSTGTRWRWPRPGRRSREVLTPEAYEHLERLRGGWSKGSSGASPSTGCRPRRGLGAKGCVVFAADRSATTATSWRGRPVQPRALADPAQRRGVPAALGQGRAVAALGPARRGGRRPPR